MTFFADETVQIEAFAESLEMSANRVYAMYSMLHEKEERILITHTSAYLRFLPQVETFKNNITSPQINIKAPMKMFSKNNSNVIKLVSDGYDMATIDIDDLAVRENEAGNTESLIRGVLKGLKDRGYAIGGFNAYTTSDVLVGSGLSSSAAFENVIGTII